MENLEKPADAQQLTSKVDGSTKQLVSNDFPDVMLKSGKAKELRSKWA